MIILRKLFIFERPYFMTSGPSKIKLDNYIFIIRNTFSNIFNNKTWA